MDDTRRKKLLAVSQTIDRHMNPNSEVVDQLKQMNEHMTKPKEESQQMHFHVQNPMTLKGDVGAEGKPGRDGYTPVRGKDYMTPQDIEVFAKHILDAATPKKGEHYNDGLPGKDADEEAIIQKVLAQIPKPKDGKNADESSIVEKVISRIKPKTAPKDSKEEVKIPTVQEVIAEIRKTKAIDISEIRNANPYMGKKKKLDMDDMRWHGGGISANAIYVETPTGAINSSNKVYTVTQNIQAVINFTINGQFIHPSEYTFSSSTITFVTALDSSLSGKSFTIVYV